MRRAPKPLFKARISQNSQDLHCGLQGSLSVTVVRGRSSILLNGAPLRGDIHGSAMRMCRAGVTQPRQSHGLVAWRGVAWRGDVTTYHTRYRLESKNIVFGRFLLTFLSKNREQHYHSHTTTAACLRFVTTALHAHLAPLRMPQGAESLLTAQQDSCLPILRPEVNKRIHFKPQGCLAGPLPRTAGLNNVEVHAIYNRHGGRW